MKTASKAARSWEGQMHQISKARVGVRIPAEITNIVGTSAAILAVVATGSAITAVWPDLNVWQFAGAYLAPASVAFAAYWWIAQKL